MFKVPEFWYISAKGQIEQNSLSQKQNCLKETIKEEPLLKIHISTVKLMCNWYFQGLSSKLIAFDIDMGGKLDFMCRKDGQYKVQAYGIENTFGTYFSIICLQLIVVFFLFSTVYNS